jgi:hypothetical protein
MATTTTDYITRTGDRWDLIAWKAYGTFDTIQLDDGTQVNAMAYIIDNNPDVSVDDILDPGILLQVPIIPSTVIPLATDLVPPWKQ